MAKPTPGITVRHRTGCTALREARCPCGPAYRASAYDARSGKQLKRTFGRLADAKAWREDMRAGIRRGTIVAATSTAGNVGEAVDEWVVAARAGTVRTRGRKPFANGTIRAVEQSYRLRIAPTFGGRRLDRVTLLDLQEWVDGLDADGVHASTIESSVLPLRMVYRRAKTRGHVAVDPTDGLELPQKPVRGTSRRPPEPKALEALVNAVPAQDRPVWRLTLLAGLRRGELLGLRWADVDLDNGVLHVARQYAPSDAEFKATKGRRERDVPMSPTLAADLRAHRMASGRRHGLVFGQDGVRPLDSGKLQGRADAAWKAAGIDRVTPHVCRHLYASLMAAAGVPLERLSRYMGHSSIAVTFDNYGHLFPGDETADATLQEAYLAGLDHRLDHQAKIPGPA